MADPLEKLLAGPKGPVEGDAAPEDDAASDVLAAIAAKDAKGLSLALKRHYEACSSAEVEPDEDDEPAEV